MAPGADAASPEKALRYSLEAGRPTYAFSAYRDAFDHFGNACRLTEGRDAIGDHESRLDALEGRGQAARSSPRSDCVNVLRDFLALSDGSGSSRQRP